MWDLWCTKWHLDRVYCWGLHFSAVSITHIHSLITDVIQYNVSERQRRYITHLSAEGRNRLRKRDTDKKRKHKEGENKKKIRNSVRSESRCALGHRQICRKCLGIKLNGFRPSWTSLPTPLISEQRLSELPLPCVTVCHHISAGLYRSLSAQRLSKRAVIPSPGLSPRLFCYFLIHFHLLNVEMVTARISLIYQSFLNMSSHFAPNTLQVSFPISRQHIFCSW